MAQYLEYRTAEGDRWDLIAYAAYGDAFRYEPIMALNPGYLHLPVLPGGVVLTVPILEEQQTKIANLPPWKR